MRKFFHNTLFVLFVISLFTMTGCGYVSKPTTIRQCDTDTYSYTVICIHDDDQWPPFSADGKYIFEFKGGNPEQRKDQKTMLFYIKGVAEHERTVYEEIDNSIDIVQRMQQK